MSTQHQSGGTALSGKIAWITGAGSGVGEAAAVLMARAGAKVVLTGRRLEPLEAVAAQITAAGGTAMVAAGDVTDKATAANVVTQIVARFGRLDILVNNAGMNIKNRKLAELTPDTIDEMVAGNLNGAYYNVLAALNVTRAQKDGLLIHTASWAGKYISQISGSTYSTAKAAVIAMSETINVEEFRNGIRSSVLCPNEIATPMLEKRPVKVTDEEKARMLQMEDMGNLIVYIASQPPHVCINEVVISPTWNRFYEKMI
ncbi:MAG: SDR family oxidoreductase [Beijerinckiaceae bacterium]